jgi:hypothetical protein
MGQIAAVKKYWEIIPDNLSILLARLARTRDFSRPSHGKMRVPIGG